MIYSICRANDGNTMLFCFNAEKSYTIIYNIRRRCNGTFYGEKALHICRYRAKNTIYCVVRTRGTDDKKISAFLMNFFEKSCCICRSFVLNYFSTRGKGVLCLFIRSLICDDAVGGCTLMQGITAEYVRF